MPGGKLGDDGLHGASTGQWTAGLSCQACSPRVPTQIYLATWFGECESKHSISEHSSRFCRTRQIVVEERLEYLTHSWALLQSRHGHAMPPYIFPQHHQTSRCCDQSPWLVGEERRNSVALNTPCTGSNMGTCCKTAKQHVILFVSVIDASLLDHVKAFMRNLFPMADPRHSVLIRVLQEHQVA